MNKFFVRFCFVLLVIISSVLKAQDREAEFKYQEPVFDLDIALTQDPLDFYIFLDQNFNVSSRLKTEKDVKNNLMKPEEKEAVLINLYAVKKTDIEVMRSEELTKSAVAFSSDQNMDEILVPVLPDQKEEFERKTGLVAVKTVKAKKLLGRASYQVLSGQGMPIFTFKFLQAFPFNEQIGYRGILNTDYILDQSQGSNERLAGIIPETSFIKIKKLNWSHSVIYRDTSAISQVEGSVRIVPGHGLLGCTLCVERLAAKQGLSAMDWKKNVLMPASAKALAIFHLRYGVSPEAHTQNTLFEVDFSTGEIKRVLFRDLSDVLIDPLAAIANEKFRYDPRWEKLKYRSWNHGEFTDWTVPEAKDIWYHTAIYAGQLIDSHIKGFFARRNMTKAFLAAYIKEIETIVNERLDLSEDAKKVLESLKTAKNLEELYKGQLQERGSYRNAVASVLISVWSVLEEKWIQKIQKTSSNSDIESYDQNLKLLKRSMKNQDIRYTSQAAKEHLNPLYTYLSSHTESLAERINLVLIRYEKIKENIYHFFNLSNRTENLIESKDRFKKDKVYGILQSFLDKYVVRWTFGVGKQPLQFKSIANTLHVLDENGKSLAVLVRNYRIGVSCESLF